MKHLMRIIHSIRSVLLYISEDEIVELLFGYVLYNGYFYKMLKDRRSFLMGIHEMKKCVIVVDIDEDKDITDKVRWYPDFFVDNTILGHKNYHIVKL